MRRCSSVGFAFAIRPWWTSSSYRIAALVSPEAAGTPTPPRSVFPSTSLLVIQVYLKHSQTLLVSHLTHLHDTVLKLSQAAGPHRSYLHSDHSAACWTQRLMRWKHVQDLFKCKQHRIVKVSEVSLNSALNEDSAEHSCHGFPARLGHSGQLRFSGSQLCKFLFCTGFQRAQQIDGATSLHLEAKGKGTKTSWLGKKICVLREYVARPF